jgi:hypothetical protein
MPGDAKPIRTQPGKDVTFPLPLSGEMPANMGLQLVFRHVDTGSELFAVVDPAPASTAARATMRVNRDARPGEYRLYLGTQVPGPSAPTNWVQKPYPIPPDMVEDLVVIVEQPGGPEQPSVPPFRDPD